MCISKKDAPVLTIYSRIDHTRQTHWTVFWDRLISWGSSIYIYELVDIKWTYTTINNLVICISKKDDACQISVWSAYARLLSSVASNPTWTNVGQCSLHTGWSLQFTCGHPVLQVLMNRSNSWPPFSRPLAFPSTSRGSPMLTSTSFDIHLDIRHSPWRVQTI
jgi:hypothetical protein